MLILFPSYLKCFIVYAHISIYREIYVLQFVISYFAVVLVDLLLVVCVCVWFLVFFFVLGLGRALAGPREAEAEPGSCLGWGLGRGPREAWAGPWVSGGNG